MESFTLSRRKIEMLMKSEGDADGDCGKEKGNVCDRYDNDNYSTDAIRPCGTTATDTIPLLTATITITITANTTTHTSATLIIAILNMQ